MFSFADPISITTIGSSGSGGDSGDGGDGGDDVEVLEDDYGGGIDSGSGSGGGNMKYVFSPPITTSARNERRRSSIDHQHTLQSQQAALVSSIGSPSSGTIGMSGGSGTSGSGSGDKKKASGYIGTKSSDTTTSLSALFAKKSKSGVQCR